MSPTINGLHHVTAISGAPQRNLDFYAKVLGLRFVKRTVNFDDPSVYHLYYGNETGAPGTAMTFFPWEHLPPARRGTGEVAQTAFTVPAGSHDFWRERLARLGVPHDEPEPVFDERALALSDPDGLPLALVAADEADARAPWTTPEIGPEHAVRGFYGVTLALEVGAATADLLTEVMGYEHLASAGRTHRYAAPHSATARYLDIIEAPDARAGVERARLGPSHRVRGRGRRRPGSLPAAADQRGPSGHAAHRSHLFPLDLFRHAGRRAVRDRDRRPGVHPRRAARDPRARAEAAAPARASSGPARGEPAASAGRIAAPRTFNSRSPRRAGGGGARGRSRTCKPMAGLPALIRQLRAREMNGTLPCLVARQPSVRCSTYRHTAGAQ